MIEHKSQIELKKLIECQNPLIVYFICLCDINITLAPFIEQPGVTIHYENQIMTIRNVINQLLLPGAHCLEKISNKNKNDLKISNQELVQLANHSNNSRFADMRNDWTRLK